MSEGPESNPFPAPPTVQPESTEVGAVRPAHRLGTEPAPPTLPLRGDIGPALPPTDGYEVVSILGRGSMGVVYLARQRGLDRLVAVKVFYAASVHAARFYSEAQILAAVQHPGIVPVHEAGEANGVPFLTLEYCPGGNLGDRLAATPQPPRQAAQWVEVLARTMEAAHRARIIHRDLKPANVLVTEDGRLLIADFGLAKRLDLAGPTATGAILGTPSYMAPEQADGRNRQVGPAADIYALGAILYEMLTGRPPYQGESALETLQRILHEEPPPLRQLRPDVPHDLETICLQAMNREPLRRYATAEALADDLARFLRGEPVAARRLGIAARLGRWLCRPERIRQAGEFTLFHALVRGGIALVIVASYLFKLRTTALNANQWFDIIFALGFSGGLFWAGWRMLEKDAVAIVAALVLAVVYLETRLPLVWGAVVYSDDSRLDEPFTLLSPLFLYTLLSLIQLAAGVVALGAWRANRETAIPT